MKACLTGAARKHMVDCRYQMLFRMLSDAKFFLPSEILPDRIHLIRLGNPRPLGVLRVKSLCRKQRSKKAQGSKLKVRIRKRLNFSFELSAIISPSEGKSKSCPLGRDSLLFIPNKGCET